MQRHGFPGRDKYILVSVPPNYSAGQQKSTNLVVWELEIFRLNGPQNHDQGA